MAEQGWRYDLGWSTGINNRSVIIKKLKITAKVMKEWKKDEEEAKVKVRKADKDADKKTESAEFTKHSTNKSILHSFLSFYSFLL